MHDFLIFFLVGMLGSDVAHNISNKDANIKISFAFVITLFSLIFTLCYVMGLMTCLIGYFLNDFIIPWQNLGLFCLIVAFLITLSVFIMDKIRR